MESVRILNRKTNKVYKLIHIDESSTQRNYVSLAHEDDNLKAILMREDIFFLGIGEIVRVYNMAGKKWNLADAKEDYKNSKKKMKDCKYCQFSSPAGSYCKVTNNPIYLNLIKPWICKYYNKE